MDFKTGAAALGNIDWSKFDFSRWNLEGLPLEGTPASAASLVQNVISSPQWPQALGSTLPAIKTAVIQQLTTQVKTLQDRSTALDRELSTRTSRLRSQAAAVQEKIRTASLPPLVATDPNKFQFVTKAVDQKSQLGLPGLMVQLFDPRKPGVILATGTTDNNGNATLSVNKEQAQVLANEKVELTLAILNSAGKTLQTVPNAVGTQANHVETRVAAIAASPDAAGPLALANRFNAADTALLSSLNSKADQLKQSFAKKKADIQGNIDQVQNTIKAIQAELNAPKP